MKQYQVVVHHLQSDQIYTAIVGEDQYILEAFEKQGIELPFACRNGACTTCAVHLQTGIVDQREAVGLSKVLQQEGYALICIGYPRSDLTLETQNEDEVYQLQFGQYFAKYRPPLFRFPWFGEE